VDSVSLTVEPTVVPPLVIEATNWNWGFEFPAVADGTADWTVPGWTEYEPSGNAWEWELFNPDAGWIPAEAQGGANVLVGVGYNNATAYVEQVLTNMTLHNGMRYTLSGWAADPDGAPESGARFFLYAGASLLGVVTNIPSAVDTWNQASLVYDAGASNPLAGQNLKIRIMNGIDNSYVVMVDNLSLTFEPEPVAAVAPNFTGTTRLSNGDMEFTATGLAGQPYSLLASTNLSLPLASWTVVASGTVTTSPFTLTHSPGNEPQTFYIFKAP